MGRCRWGCGRCGRSGGIEWVLSYGGGLVCFPDMSDDFSMDSFFRLSFSRIEIAGNYLEEYLPPKMLAYLNIDEMMLEQGRFIDEEMKAHHADLLYTVPLDDGSAASVYFLFEHKAQPDREIGFQLLRYMVRIWEEQKRNQIERRPIIPLVIYHGEKRWAAGESFQEGFQVAEPFRPYVPQFHYVFRDFSYRSQIEIRGRAWLETCLAVLQAINHPDLKRELIQVVRLAQNLKNEVTGVDYFYAILYYVSQATDRVDSQDLREALQKNGQKGDSDMATIAQMFREEGRVEGRVEALHSSMINILMLRFGQLPYGLENDIRRVLDTAVLQELTASAAISMTIEAFMADFECMA